MKKNVFASSVVLLMRRKCASTAIVVIAIILGITPIMAYAADPSADAIYWQGPSNLTADWFSGSNWDKGVPGSSNDVCIDNGRSY